MSGVREFWRFIFISAESVPIGYGIEMNLLFEVTLAMARSLSRGVCGPLQEAQLTWE